MKPLNHLAAAKPLSELPTAGAISRYSPTLPAQMPLCDRFQGALLGLWLVPVAAANYPTEDRRTLTEAIAFSFEHITWFTASSHSHPQLQSGPEGSPPLSAKRPSKSPFWSPFWLANLPKLLRYHDSRERRWQCFSTAELPGTVAQLDFLLGESLILGDLLEFALSGRITSPVDCLAQMQRSQPDGLRPESCRHYQSILAEILARLSQPTAAEVPRSVSDHADFINGVLSALTHLESYRLSVQVAHGGMAPLVAGVLAGAVGGRSALPVMWQMKSVSETKQAHPPSSRLYQAAGDESGKQAEKQDDLDSLIDEKAVIKAARVPQQRSEVISLANQLFEQWAGVAPAASRPIILADWAG